MKAALLESCEYQAWANSTLLEQLAGLEELPFTVEGILAHLAAATTIWVDRVEGLPTMGDVSPSMPFADSHKMIVDADARAIRLVQTRDPSEVIEYRNTQGVPFSNPLHEIIRHVVNHGTYHRGQIAGQLVAIGVEPASTDLIQFYRIR